MTKEQIREIFMEKFNGQPNYVTPEIIEYGQKGNYIYEISKGKIMRKTLYGVTVLTIDGDRNFDLDKSFSSYGEAKGYVESL